MTKNEKELQEPDNFQPLTLKERVELKYVAAMEDGEEVFLDPDEADLMLITEETALSPEDAEDARFDEEAEGEDDK